MRVIWVTHAYPRWDGDVAGAFLERLAVSLASRGHVLTVVAPADGGRAGREERLGIEVWRVRYAPASRETLAYRGTMLESAGNLGGAVVAGCLVVALAAAIRRAVRSRGADLVHAHWWVPGGLSAWLTTGGRGPDYVVTLHGTDVRLLERGRGVRAVGRRVLRRAAAVTAVSAWLADRAVRAARLAPGSVVVQPMPADVDRLRRTSGGGGGVVTVGRLTAQKRVDLVIEAVAHLRRAGRRLSLTVIGDGPERGRLEALAAAAGIGETTRFLGAVAPERLPAALGDADVFAFAAVGEGFGLAAAEALTLGIPVVALRAGGGVTDIVPPTGGGRLVEQETPEALASAIGDVIADPQSRPCAAQAGEELRRRLHPDAVARTFERVYERAVEGSARAS